MPVSPALFAATQSSAASRPMISLHAAMAMLAATFWSSSWRAFALSMVLADARFIMVCSKVLIGAAQCVVIHPGWSRNAR